MYKSIRGLTILGASLLALTACQKADVAATSAQSAIQAQSTPTLSTTDTTFLNMAVTSGIEEVTFGQWAQTHASSPAVRQFAQQMVSDHSPANRELERLAQAKQLTPPSSMDRTHDQLYQQLQSMHGREFDRAYINGQVQDHQLVVETFQTEAQSGTDPDVRAFAAQHLPVMQQHLQEALNLQKRLQSR